MCASPGIDAAAERSGNAPRFYAEARVGSAKGNVRPNFSGLVDKKDRKGLEESWNAPNSKRVPARVKKVHVPKPVLSDAVALKDRPGPEETALRWIGASVVAEQELVLA